MPMYYKAESNLREGYEEINIFFRKKIELYNSHEKIKNDAIFRFELTISVQVKPETKHIAKPYSLCSEKETRKKAS